MNQPIKICLQNFEHTLFYAKKHKASKNKTKNQKH